MNSSPSSVCSCGVRLANREHSSGSSTASPLLSPTLDVYFPVTITPGLLLGDTTCASSRITLVKSAITHVLNVSDARLKPVRYPASVTSTSVWMCPTGRHTPLVNVLPQCFEFLESAAQGKKNVCLIYCESGQNQSVVVLLAYYVVVKGMQIEEAARMIKCRCNSIKPNVEYIWQLMHICRSVRHSLEEPTLDGLQSICKILHEECPSSPVASFATSPPNLPRKRSTSCSDMSDFKGKLQPTRNVNCLSMVKSPGHADNANFLPNCPQVGRVVLGTKGTPGADRDLPDVKLPEPIAHSCYA